MKKLARWIKAAKRSVRAQTHTSEFHSGYLLGMDVAYSVVLDEIEMREKAAKAKARPRRGRATRGPK